MSLRRGDALTPVDVEILTRLDRGDLATTPIDTTLLERDTVVFHRRQGNWIAAHERHSPQPRGG